MLKQNPQKSHLTCCKCNSRHFWTFRTQNAIYKSSQLKRNLKIPRLQLPWLSDWQNHQCGWEQIFLISSSESLIFPSQLWVWGTVGLASPLTPTRLHKFGIRRSVSINNLIVKEFWKESSWTFSVMGMPALKQPKNQSSKFHLSGGQCICPPRSG